jgi:hypothetical protein
MDDRRTLLLSIFYQLVRWLLGLITVLMRWERVVSHGFGRSPTRPAIDRKRHYGHGVTRSHQPGEDW